MHKIHEVLHLCFENGPSARKTARTLFDSHTMIDECLRFVFERPDFPDL